MGCRGLKPYSRADVERTVLIRLHDIRVTRFEIPSNLGTVFMYDIVLWHQGGLDRSQEWTPSQCGG